VCHSSSRLEMQIEIIYHIICTAFDLVERAIIAGGRHSPNKSSDSSGVHASRISPSR
jgi:hypothetical protein